MRFQRRLDELLSMNNQELARLVRDWLETLKPLNPNPEAAVKLSMSMPDNEIVRFDFQVEDMKPLDSGTIKRFMESAGIQERTLAALMGCTADYVSDVLSGEAAPGRLFVENYWKLVEGRTDEVVMHSSPISALRKVVAFENDHDFARFLSIPVKSLRALERGDAKMGANLADTVARMLGNNISAEDVQQQQVNFCDSNAQ